MKLAPGIARCADYVEITTGAETERIAHPAKYPVRLAAWLLRLVTEPGDLVCDPFAGSGTTGVAALAEGRRFVGIERDAGYCELARRRIADVQPTLDVA